MNIVSRTQCHFSLYLLTFIFYIAPLSDAAAACSLNVGKVVFNEVYRPTSGTALVELKVLDPSVLAATSNFQNWKIKLYAGNSSTSQETDVSSGFSNSATNSCGQTSLWIQYNDSVLSFLTSQSPPFNFVLYDTSGGGQIIDIMRLGNNVTSFYGAGTQYTSCPAIESQLPATGSLNTQYDAQQGSGSSIKDWYRNPDGTGPWDSSTSNPLNTSCGSNQGGAGTFGLAKVPASTSVSVNTNFNYTLYAINGATAVTTPDPVIITDTLPAGVSFVSCTATPGTVSGTSSGPAGTCTHAAGVVTWTVGTMAANKNYKVTLTVRATSGGVISNSIISNVGSPPVSAIAATVTAYAPLADYRMDEAGWNSTAGEVLDNSGNGNNARAYNSASTASTTRAISGNPGTCGYGVFENGTTITQGYIDTPLPNLTTNFTITAWIKTTNNTVAGQRILIDDQGSGSATGYGFSLADGTAGRLRFYSRGITPVILDSTYTIANNTWYFVAAVADITNKRRTIYVYSQSGVLLSSSTDAAAWTGTWGTDSGPVSIGGETNASAESPASFHFRGNLDEVRVYQQALSQTVLDTFATQSHPCPTAAPDHIRIEHDGSAVSCVAEAVVVKACANASCSSLYTSGVTGILTAGGNVVAFNIPGGQSQVTVNIHLPTNSALADPQTVRLGSSSVTPTPIDAASPYCSNSGGAVNNTTACDMSVYRAGFIFDVPNLTSGTASGTVNISAVRSSDSSTCVPLFQSVTHTVSFWGAYQNPASGTLPVQLNGSNIETTATPAYTSTATLVFNASGVATLSSVRYDDVGLMQLNARYSGSAANTPPDGGMIVTGNDTFVVKPAKFALSAIKCSTIDAANCGAGALAMPTAGDNPAAASAAGVTFIRAGHPFSVTATALNSLNAATPNYGQESAPESVKLTANNVIAGMVAAPAVGGSFASFTAGVASGTSFTWNEVGIVTLTPSVADGDYLGAGDVTGTSSGNVGRFFPAYFDTVITQVSNVPMACPAGLTCPLDYPGFVYSGQPFSLTVTARNAGGGTAANYNTTTGFAKTTGLAPYGVLGTITVPGGAGTLGVANVSTFAAGTLTEVAEKYTFTSASTVPTNIYIRASDGEASSLRAVNPTTTSVEGGVAVVSGRIKVSNAYGSELLPLTLSANAQFYTANGWAASTSDSLTHLTFAATYPVGTGTTAVTITPVSSNLSGGTLSIKLAKPTGGATGIATITPTAPGYLPVIPGTATFGVYKSNNNFIYQRESY